MMLHSFGLRFKPWTDYAETIRSEISRRARTPVIFHDHSLLNAQLQDDKSDGPFVDYLRALYEEKPPDLIIAFGAPAASFVQRYRDRLFPGTPMVFTAVEARRVQYDKLTENDAVVATRNDFTAAFENILQLLPDTKTIAIVNGVSANERFWEGELRRELAPFGRRVELKWFTDLPFEGILKKAANLPPHSAIFWHLLNVDAAGVTHETNCGAEQTFRLGQRADFLVPRCLFRRGTGWRSNAVFQENERGGRGGRAPYPRGRKGRRHQSADCRKRIAEIRLAAAAALAHQRAATSAEQRNHISANRSMAAVFRAK